MTERHDIAFTPGVHATVLTGRNAAGVDISATIVWADLPTIRCPRCRESIPADTSQACPVVLNGDGLAVAQVQPWAAWHGCGKWIGARWEHVDPDGPADVDESATRLATWLRAEREKIRADVHNRLHRDLDNALARLTVGDDNVVTGSETVPGVYTDDGVLWIAWDYDPTDDSATIGVDSQIDAWTR